MATLTAEFRQDSRGFFILTNSRALPPLDAEKLIREICENVAQAAAATGQSVDIVLRGDSTLRGHFPLEADVAESVFGPADAWVLAPFFFQGGRYTIADVHYVAEGDNLVPAGATQFARDATFGYRSSNLRDYVQEKAPGRFGAGQLHSVSIEDIRIGGPRGVYERLKSVPKGGVVIVNAAAESDMHVFVAGLLLAEAEGKRFLYRTGAAFVSTRLGVRAKAPISAAELQLARPRTTGGLIIAGSYVPKTTAQLKVLTDRRGGAGALAIIEMDVERLIASPESADEVIRQVVQETEGHLQAGQDTLVMTSRKLITGDNELSSLAIGTSVAQALVRVLQRIQVRPRYIIAKGGITSSDAATKGLNVKRAWIVGQAAPGVPLWRCDEPTSRHRGVPFVVFPGNVGGEATLFKIIPSGYEFLIPAIHLEVISPATSIPRASVDSPHIPPTPERDERPQETVDGSLTPAEGQQVFTHAQLRATTKTRQIAITALIILSNLVQIVQMTVNFAGVAGGRQLGEALHIQNSYASWIAASYALTQGTFVLMSGRVGDVYGHRKVLLCGGAWLTACTLASAFCTEFYAFVTMRALSGVGGACIMPNAVAMIATTNPPGRVRNLSLGLFGASAPLGGYLGALFLGAFLKQTEWKWFFVFIAGLGAVTFVFLWMLSPREPAVDRHGKIDWVGSALGTSALILFNFVWNQAPSVGWSTPYEIALLIISVVLFAMFNAWEKYGTAHPIMPLDIFRAPCFLTLILVVLLNYMAVGTLIWYQVLWLQDVWQWTPLQFAVGWTPFVVCGTAAACLAAWLIPRLAAQWILAIGTVTILVSTVLMATVPLRQSYWAQIFPSVVLFAFCPDLVYTAGQIIASNSVRRHQQGIAGSIIGTLNLYGNSLGLGFASTIEVQIARAYDSPVLGYRAALYFGVGISTVALLLDVFFVRLVKDEREGWEEDVDLVDMSDRAAATGAQLPSQGVA
ncbi:hypothetical protein BJX96DRAFT_166411 [Aspergillus floccosus]